MYSENVYQLVNTSTWLIILLAFAITALAFKWMISAFNDMKNKSEESYLVEPTKN